MNDPKKSLEGQAKEQWELLQRLVERDIENQIEDHLAERDQERRIVNE